MYKYNNPINKLVFGRLGSIDKFLKSRNGELPFATTFFFIICEFFGDILVY